MNAEAFLVIPFLMILWGGALIILLFALQFVCEFVDTLWCAICNMRDVILQLINRRSEK